MKSLLGALAAIAAMALGADAHSDPTDPCEEPPGSSPSANCQEPSPGTHPDPNEHVKHLPSVETLAAVEPIAISAGALHSLALAADGTVWTWGLHPAGYEPGRQGTLTPIQVSGLNDVIAISAGHFFSLALLKDGTVRAWGNNVYGQLGTGDFNENLTPVAVRSCSAGSDCGDDGSSGTTEVLDHVVAIAAGASHALALRDDGTVWSWGKGGAGLLGQGRPNPPILAKSVALEVASLSHIGAIAADYGHSFAVTHAGELFSWGNNDYGQLGDGTLDSRYSPVPTVGPRAPVVAAGAGPWHSVALRSDGAVFTWGSNGASQLGDGGGDDRAVPGQVGPLGEPLGGVTAIAAGGLHTVVLRTDGTLAAWGSNSHGQLGNGNNTPATQNLPVDVLGLNPVAIPLLPGKQGVTQISARNGHSFALDSTCKVIWGWGDNHHGELGNGRRDNVNVLPTPVMLGGGVFNHNGLLPTRSACYVLGVTKTGDGRGTVSESSGLLDCGPNCPRAYARYVRPLLGSPTVTLTATPHVGSRFAGWGEACAAASTAPVAVINVTRSTLCTATFEVETSTK